MQLFSRTKRQEQASNAYPPSTLTLLDTTPHKEVLRQTLFQNALVSVRSPGNKPEEREQVRGPRRESRVEDLQKEPSIRIKHLGEGTQGTVFEEVGQPNVIKKEKPGNEALPSNLRNEWNTHADIIAGFALYDRYIHTDVDVPRLGRFFQMPEYQELWASHIDNFPKEYHKLTEVFSMSRICPLPKVVRNALIRRFYPCHDGAPIQEIILEDKLSDPLNEHCLVCPYLGKVTVEYDKTTFSLRNFPLSLSSMEEAELRVQELATSMGKAYALMHWGCCINGNGVEFVLGTRKVDMPGYLEDKDSDVEHFVTTLYLLDFGHCEVVDLSQEKGTVYQAFKNAMVSGDNTDFIPHLGESPELFEVFKTAYMDAGRIILEKKLLDDKFIMEEFMDEYVEHFEDLFMGMGTIMIGISEGFAIEHGIGIGNETGDEVSDGPVPEPNKEIGRFVAELAARKSS